MLMNRTDVNTISDIVNRRDVNHKVITNFEDLPDFDAMSDDEVAHWWELNEISAEILTLLEDNGEEINFNF